MSPDPDLDRKLSPAQIDVTAQSISDLEAVLRIPQGRRTLLRILEQTGLFRSAYTGDLAATSLRLGEQNIGLWLIAQLETIGPTEYPQLLLDAARVRDLTGESVHVVDEE
jgi:hypothetical protein